MPDTSHIHTAQPTEQTNRTVALAAIVQSASLVESIARNGTCDNEDFDTMIRSLFAGHHDSVSSTYGGLYHLRAGIHLSTKLLSGNKIEHEKQLMAYVAGMIMLEKKLSANRAMLASIAEGMERVKKQADYFGSPTHESVIGGIADLYGNTVSALKPKIIVRGKPEHLKQGANTNKVRALLLSGIRAAHFWHRHGGGHLRLLIGRKKLHRTTQELLEDALKK